MSFVAVTSQIILGKVHIEKFMRIFNKLYKIEKELRNEFQIEIPYRKIAYASIALTLTSSFLEIIGFLSAVMGYLVNRYYMPFLVSIYVSYTLLSLQVVYGQFLNGILIYRHLFSGVGNYLMDFFMSLAPDAFMDDIRVAKSVRILRISSRIHQELCENLRKFNELLSIQLLLSFACHYVQICLQAFFMIIIFSADDKKHLYYVLVMIFILVAVILKLGVGIINSHLCINEMSKLTHLVWKMSTLKNAEVRKEANNFALQMLHEKIEITAAGFFDIDAKVIFSMAAGAAIYTILLVQFYPKMKL
ncbi:putative gustatory receptor [Trypoxylus dichotomus]